MTIPMPESRSKPGPIISIAVVVSVVRICAGVREGFADLTSAATEAALGAAAEVPKNRLGNPPTPVTDTPSAPVISGLLRTVPPVEEKLPGLMAVESPLKKMWRSPSELKVSTTLLALKGLGNGPLAGVAATV